MSDRSISRRLFGKLAAAAPMAGVVPAPSQATIMSASGVALQRIAPSPMGIYALSHPKLSALWMSGIAPEWVRRDVDREIADRARYLDPDIAGMRSISVSAKVAMNHRRMRERALAEIDVDSAINAARQLFWDTEGNRG